MPTRFNPRREAFPTRRSSSGRCGSRARGVRPLGRPWLAALGGGGARRSHAVWSECLYPAFTLYARSGAGACERVWRGKSLGLEEWGNLLTDCRVITRGFELRRAQSIHAACVLPDAPERRLLPPQFLAALVILAFEKSNASWLEAPPPGTLPPKPVAACVQELLETALVPLAARDDARSDRHAQGRRWRARGARGEAW